jgi:hypothetical protein
MERELQNLLAHVRIYEWLVQHWEKRPLPDPGKPEFDWIGHAARKLRSSQTTT